MNTNPVEKMDIENTEKSGTSAISDQVSSRSDSCSLDLDPLNLSDCGSDDTVIPANSSPMRLDLKDEDDLLRESS